MSSQLLARQTTRRRLDEPNLQEGGGPGGADQSWEMRTKTAFSDSSASRIQDWSRWWGRSLSSGEEKRGMIDVMRGDDRWPLQEEMGGGSEDSDDFNYGSRWLHQWTWSWCRPQVDMVPEVLAPLLQTSGAEGCFKQHRPRQRTEPLCGTSAQLDHVSIFTALKSSNLQQPVTSSRIHWRED